MSVARLVWQRGVDDAVEFVLDRSPMTVGREADADIRVDEALVSRAHARIELRGKSYFVLDLGSTNLTRVNDEVVAEKELHDGDQLRFARARCVFHRGEGETPTS
jgi:pSer/pThr/pTyr-binding forkhead associated (FHA) protein